MNITTSPWIVLYWVPAVKMIENINLQIIIILPKKMYGQVKKKSLNQRKFTQTYFTILIQMQTSANMFVLVCLVEYHRYHVGML